MTAVRDLVRGARPKQWVKNTLVAAVPLASGTLLEPEVLANTAIAFAAFCCAASGIYFLNDVRDIEADRNHPMKRYRPIASGAVNPGTAVATGIFLLAASLAIAALASWGLAATIAVYIGLSLAYVVWLKHEPVIDLAIVASGFLLRAVAGGAASDIAPSQWFLLVAAFGSLFMVSGKRYSEYRAVELSGDEMGLTRPSLREYSASYLRFVWSVSAAIAITAYALWAFDINEARESVFAVLSIVPFVLGILRYARDIDHGAAGEPEDVVLRDRVLQLLGGAWLASFGLAVALGS